MLFLQDPRLTHLKWGCTDVKTTIQNIRFLYLEITSLSLQLLLCTATGIYCFWSYAEVIRRSAVHQSLLELQHYLFLNMLLLDVIRNL